MKSGEERTYVFSSKDEGRGALLGGPMPAMVAAEEAEVSCV